MNKGKCWNIFYNNVAAPLRSVQLKNDSKEREVELAKQCLDDVSSEVALKYHSSHPPSSWTVLR